MCDGTVNGFFILLTVYYRCIYDIYSFSVDIHRKFASFHVHCVMTFNTFHCKSSLKNSDLILPLYQVAGATASPKYVKPLLFSRKFQFSQNKNSSFCFYVVLLSYHTKQLHNYKNCYAYVTMDF